MIINVKIIVSLMRCLFSEEPSLQKTFHPVPIFSVFFLVVLNSFNP